MHFYKNMTEQLSVGQKHHKPQHAKKNSFGNADLPTEDEFAG